MSTFWKLSLNWRQDLPVQDFSNYILRVKLVNNSSNTGNYDCDGVGYLILLSIDIYDFIFLVLVSIKKIHQTLNTVFDHISKHLIKFVKNAPLRVVFSTLSWGVWRSGRTQSVVFVQLCTDAQRFACVAYLCFCITVKTYNFSSLVKKVLVFWVSQVSWLSRFLIRFLTSL